MTEPFFLGKSIFGLSCSNGEQNVLFQLLFFGSESLLFPEILHKEYKGSDLTKIFSKMAKNRFFGFLHGVMKA